MKEQRGNYQSAGGEFTPQVGQFDLFAHFSITVTTYEYQLVPVVAE